MEMTSLQKAMLEELETYQEHPLGFQLDDARENPDYLDKLYDAFQKAKAGGPGYKFEKVAVAVFEGAKLEDEKNPKWKITYKEKTVKP